MKTKIISTLISALVASSAFAVTYDPKNSPTPLGKDGTYVQLSAPVDTTEAIFDGQGQNNLFYVILDTSNPEQDANFTIINGFTAKRNTEGNEILTFKQQSPSKGIDATLTLKDGTYNFAKSDTSELIITSQGYADGVKSNRAVVFDSSTTTNLFTSTAKFQGTKSAKVVSKGTINIYNTTYTTSVPSDVAYGQLHTYGTFVQESGTINANDMLVESVNCNINGTLNLKQKSGATHYPVVIKDNRGLTFGKDAKLTTTANSRIQLNKDSTLTIQSGEKSIAVDMIMFNGDRGTLNLSGKNSVVHTNGKFDTILLTYSGKNVAKINVDGNAPGAFNSFFGPDPLNLFFVVILTSLGTWGLPQMVQKFYAIKSEKDSLSLASYQQKGLNVFCIFKGVFCNVVHLWLFLHPERKRWLYVL